MESSNSVWGRAYKKARPHLMHCVDICLGKDRECLQNGKIKKVPYDCVETTLFPLCHVLRKMEALRKARKEAAGETLQGREK